MNGGGERVWGGGVFRLLKGMGEDTATWLQSKQKREKRKTKTHKKKTQTKKEETKGKKNGKPHTAHTPQNTTTHHRTRTEKQGEQSTGASVEGDLVRRITGYWGCLRNAEGGHGRDDVRKTTSQQRRVRKK